MSKIEELIEKLCPNGVEFKKLEEITKSINIGINPRKFFKLNPADSTGFYVTVRELNGLKGVKEYEKTDKINDEAIQIINNRANIENGDILFSNTGTVGKLALVNETPTNWGVNEGIYIIKPIEEKILSKYLYYYLDSSHAYKDYSSKFTGSTLKHVTQKALASLIVAVPPLDVQCEIVHILDDFTLLSAELSAELKARQKQYEYYMDKIFNNATQTKMVKLSDVLVSLKTGLNPRKFFQLNTPDANGYYVTVRELGDRNVRYWESKDRINQIGLSRINERSNLEINDVLFSGTGTIGRVSIIEEKPENWNVKEGVYILKPKIDLINPVFLMYLMKSNYMRNIYSNYIVGSPVSSVPMKDLKNVEFDLPSIEEQEKIVRILDRFDQLCTDISEGLPAEIEARQKQYEYYRDKLLTFKELKVNE